MRGYASSQTIKGGKKECSMKSFLWWLIVLSLILIGIWIMVKAPCTWFKYTQVPGRCVGFYSR